MLGRLRDALGQRTNGITRCLNQREATVKSDDMCKEEINRIRLLTRAFRFEKERRKQTECPIDGLTAYFHTR
ncbi:hypothetical protein J6590_095650, partial [Homalodisca vitripennis]